jgi:hypothetical protein
MMKLSEVVARLQSLAQGCAASATAYRQALTCTADAQDKVLYISLWQDRSRMATELVERIRLLRGEIDSAVHMQPWVGLAFQETDITECIKAISRCEQVDLELVEAYGAVLKIALPIELQLLLLKHLKKIKASQPHVEQKLASHLPKSSERLTHSVLQLQPTN